MKRQKLRNNLWLILLSIIVPLNTALSWDRMFLRIFGCIVIALIVVLWVIRFVEYRKQK